MKRIGVLVIFAVVFSFAASMGLAQDQASQDEQIKAYIEMIRKDIRTERNTIVDQAMNLEPAEKAKFWGVYDKYAQEIKGIWDERLANILKYAENFQTMTDATADELATKAIDLRTKELAILKKYYGEMKKALGPRVAGRFYQVETMLGNVIGLNLSSQIPLVE